MLPEWPVGADGSLQNDARRSHSRLDDVRIVAFLRRALVEEIAVSAPGFEGRFHGGSGDRQIEEAQRELDRELGRDLTRSLARDSVYPASDTDRDNRRSA